MEKKKGFFEGSFGKFVLPGIILQSVMIGGGYATGREIVEYGAKYGALGWLSGLGTFLGFAVIAALTYELIRLTKAYDFKTFMKTIGELCGLCSISFICCLWLLSLLLWHLQPVIS